MRRCFNAVSSKTRSKGHLFSHNWNGRINVSQTVDILKQVNQLKGSLPFDLYVGCTVQEQVGLRGAQTATNLVQPDLAIILDTQKEMNYQEIKEKSGTIGRGLLLTYYDTTVLPNRYLLRSMKEACEAHEVSYQLHYSLEDSDAGWINKLRTGCPTLLLGLSVRNMNTPSQIVSLKDYQSLVRGLMFFIQELTVEKIQAFKEENR
ncbi:zinc-binding metallopeptidase family protein [Enterococcus massiliensis]|uniref:hypothetical protein n=1 Tax=Enterococcus massiliensis TaxID=1640685 RepID=UPI0009E383B5|nr:hypothetical protein [Enterococcus massiliensis]